MAATAGKAKAVDATEVSVDGGPLVPGASRTLNVTFNNQNSYPVKITGVTVKSITVDNGPSCDTAEEADVAVTVALPADPPGIVVLPNATTTHPFPGAVTMGYDSDDSCQGAAFKIDLGISAASAKP